MFIIFFSIFACVLLRLLAEELLTRLTEGILQKVGVPAKQAKEAIKTIDARSM